MRIWERLLINRLELHFNISGQQCGFVSGHPTTDAIFIIRQLVEKFSRKKIQLYHILVELEKAFDKVARAAIQQALRRQRVPERLVILVMALYTSFTYKVRVAGELSTDFPIDVGVHQGSALSPLLFIIVMEKATKQCRKGDPLEPFYADDLILTSETRQ